MDPADSAISKEQVDEQENDDEEGENLNLAQKKTERLLSSKAFGFLPFLVLMVVAPTKPQLALWIGFGLMTLVIALEVYRHTYKPKHPPLYWLSCAFWCTFLGLAVARYFTDFGNKLISAVISTVLFATCALSMLVGRPFTMQFSQAMVPEQVAKSEGFVKVNYALTSVWLVIFAIMTTCSWVAQQLTNLPYAAEVILAWVVPIILPLLGGAVMKPLAAWFKNKYAPPEDDDQVDQDKEELAEQPDGATTDKETGI